MEPTNPLNPQTPALQPISPSPAVATPMTPAKPLQVSAAPVLAPVTPAPKPVAPAVPAPTMPPVVAQAAPVAAISVPKPVAAPIAASVTPTAPATMPVSSAPVAAKPTTFQLPSQPKPVANVPAPTPTAMPAPQNGQIIKQAAAGAGSLFKKVALALTIVVVFGGAVGLGYSVFPETFYNNFGKFIGLPAPAGVEENVAVDVVAPENTEAQKASAPEVVDLNALLESLPGADANLVAYFNATQVSKDGIKKLTLELEKYFVPAPKTETAETAPAEDELANALSQVEAFVLVTKLEPGDITKSPSALSTSTPPVAVAIKVSKENEAKLLEKLNSLKTAPNSQAELVAVTFEGNENGIILVKNNADKLTGKASESTLAKSLLETKDVNFALGVNVKSLVKTEAPATEAAASTDTTGVATLKMSGQNPFEDLAKIESAIITANFEYANDQYSFKVNAISSFADDSTASDVLTKILQPQLMQFQSFMPEDFKSFFVFNSFAEAKNITVNIEIKDFIGLTQKLIQARDNLQAADTKKQEDLKNITTDTAPVDITAPDTTTPAATGVKVPRKKPAPATVPADTTTPASTPAATPVQ
ncbi:MAG: hypothetical protein WCT53_03970 [Candidatus Gracilibacteria bacterium]